MIPNIYQSVDEIIKSCDPEIRILWQQIRLITRENASIRQFHYQGACAGSEYLTNVTGRLYLIINASFGHPSYGNPINPLITVYNESDAISFYIYNCAPVWDTTGAAIKNFDNYVTLRNFYFGRLSVVNYSHMILTGFKIQ